MINVTLNCEICGGLHDILVTQGAVNKKMMTFDCSCCGNRWYEFMNGSERRALYIKAIEEATFGLWLEGESEIEKTQKIISEIRRLNQIENRADQYLQAIKSPKVMNAYDHWTRKIVEYVLNGRVIPSGGVIEY